MSHIFDALVKSEAEHTGVGALEASEAIEWLQDAERRASAKWQSNAQELQRTEGAQEGVASIRAAIAAAGVFKEIQSLPVSPTQKSRLVALTETESPATEAFRILSVRLRNIQREMGIKSLLITSTIPQEGKSVIAGNLACTVGAKGEQKTLLVEGDLRRPSLMKLFGLEGAPGLKDCLQDNLGLTRCVHYLEGAGIWIYRPGRLRATRRLFSSWKGCVRSWNS